MSQGYPHDLRARATLGWAPLMDLRRLAPHLRTLHPRTERSDSPGIDGREPLRTTRSDRVQERSRTAQRLLERTTRDGHS